MNRTQHTALEKRMQIIRQTVLHLGRFGLPYSHYAKELAILENNVRAARMEIEKLELQELLF